MNGSLNLDNSALLVVDMQRYFLEPCAPAFLKDGPRIIPNVAKLIQLFRTAEKPVVITRHAHGKGKSTGQMGRWWADELPWDGTREAELIKEISPRPKDILITKDRYSAFENTRLDMKLRALKVSTVIICGVMTNLCVETTARDAFIKDYQPVIVEDACATKNRAYHKASILNLSYGFALIRKTDEIIKTLH